MLPSYNMEAVDDIRTLNGHTVRKNNHVDFVTTAVSFLINLKVTDICLAVIHLTHCTK